MTSINGIFILLTWFDQDTTWRTARVLMAPRWSHRGRQVSITWDEARSCPPAIPYAFARIIRGCSHADSARLFRGEMPREPLHRRLRGCLEILDVGVKMPTLQRHQSLRLERSLIRGERQVGDGQHTARPHHHQ